MSREKNAHPDRGDGTPFASHTVDRRKNGLNPWVLLTTIELNSSLESIAYPIDLHPRQFVQAGGSRDPLGIDRGSPPDVSCSTSPRWSADQCIDIWQVSSTRANLKSWSRLYRFRLICHAGNMTLSESDSWFGRLWSLQKHFVTGRVLSFSSIWAKLLGILIVVLAYWMLLSDIVA